MKLALGLILSLAGCSNETAESVFYAGSSQFDNEVEVVGDTIILDGFGEEPCEVPIHYPGENDVFEGFAECLGLGCKIDGQFTEDRRGLSIGVICDGSAVSGFVGMQIEK